jgi:hypothetical protein
VSALAVRSPPFWEIPHTPLLFRLKILRILAPILRTSSGFLHFSLQPLFGDLACLCVPHADRSANWLILFMIPLNRSSMSMVGRSSLWVLPLLTGEMETNPQDSGFGRPSGRPKGERQGWRESKCRALAEIFPVLAF